MEPRLPFPRRGKSELRKNLKCLSVRITAHCASRYGTSGLYLDISVSDCHFQSRPQYILDLVGDADYWMLTPTISVTSATLVGFRAIALHPKLKGNGLVALARKDRWRISWLANTGKNTGVTVAGSTGWKQHPKAKSSVYVDVDTKDCGYSEAPKYFTAIRGFIVYWRAMGAHVIYFPKKTSFRVYVVYDKPVTPGRSIQHHENKTNTQATFSY